MTVSNYFTSGNRTRIICGTEALKEIPSAILKMRLKRPMIITDAQVDAVGLLSLVRRNIGNKLSPPTIVTMGSPHSDVAEVNRIARQFKEQKCDSFLAVGGGSVIDTAKGVNMAAMEEVYSVTRLAGIGVLTHPLYPLMAIPTTAGSGSEVSGTAVLADPSAHRKWFFTSSFLTPSVVVIDPRMTMTLPAETTAAGAMNTLSHAIEAVISSAHDPVSSAHAFSALRLTRIHLFAALSSPEDLSARLGLALASTLAGMAISATRAGLISALSHALSAVSQVSYCLCAAIMLPHGIRHNLPEIEAIADELLLHLAGDRIYALTPRHQRGEKLIAVINELNQNLSKQTEGKHITALKKLKSPEGTSRIPQDLIDTIANTAYNTYDLFFNPVNVTRMDLTRLLEYAWEGRYC